MCHGITVKERLLEKVYSLALRLAKETVEFLVANKVEEKLGEDFKKFLQKWRIHRIFNAIINSEKAYEHEILTIFEHLELFLQAHR